MGVSDLPRREVVHTRGIDFYRRELFQFSSFAVVVILEQRSLATGQIWLWKSFNNSCNNTKTNLDYKSSFLLLQLSQVKIYISNNYFILIHAFVNQIIRIRQSWGDHNQYFIYISINSCNFQFETIIKNMCFEFLVIFLNAGSPESKTYLFFIYCKSLQKI